MARTTFSRQKFMLVCGCHYLGKHTFCITTIIMYVYFLHIPNSYPNPNVHVKNPAEVFHADKKVDPVLDEEAINLELLYRSRYAIRYAKQLHRCDSMQSTSAFLASVA